MIKPLSFQTCDSVQTLPEMAKAKIKGNIYISLEIREARNHTQ